MLSINGNNKHVYLWGAWVVQAVKRPAPDFNSILHCMLTNCNLNKNFGEKKSGFNNTFFSWYHLSSLVLSVLF